MMFMAFGKKWPKTHVYRTKQFYEGDISIPWYLVTQLVQESLTLIFQMQDFVKLLVKYFK